jgi:hypothetical protein
MAAAGLARNNGRTGLMPWGLGDAFRHVENAPPAWLRNPQAKISCGAAAAPRRPSMRPGRR